MAAAAQNEAPLAPTTGLRRSGNEKFYTRDVIAKECVADLARIVPIDPETDLLLEPSAGSGAFLPHLEPLANCLIAVDIEPECNNVIKQDFLTWNGTEIVLPRGGKIITVGNPPFGRQSSLALKFIKHAAKFSKYIAFILPKSFMKLSMQEKVPLGLHLVHQRELDMNAFTINDQPHFVPCVFQIWERREHAPRVRTPPPQPNLFSFASQQSRHHFAVRRVGVNAGTIIPYPASQECNIQTHYFIHLLQTTNIPHTISNLKKCKFLESENTVGIKSISKREIVEEYESILK
jgi:hypothetical protein